ncbi:hypothetical protein P167DRAFT_571984 [Morchella conica CCBAS932]|uniref:Uncharacterized protein n=2 Tax=Morchella sect. Distantes TaxID=1051054 RepID=A0A3N4LAR9_9PEZI|nr:hypothetical protein P167DRAFT_571984 [Morchella conica CCBAS932]
MSGEYTTLTELTCMCGINTFVDEDKACVRCMVSREEISAIEATEYNDAVEAGYSSIPSGGDSGNGNYVNGGNSDNG